MPIKFETKKELRDRIRFLEDQLEELREKEHLRMELRLQKCNSRLCFACAYGILARHAPDWPAFLAGCAKDVECKDFVNKTSVDAPFIPPAWMKKYKELP